MLSDRLGRPQKGSQKAIARTFRSDLAAHTSHLMHQRRRAHPPGKDDQKGAAMKAVFAQEGPVLDAGVLPEATRRC